MLRTVKQVANWFFGPDSDSDSDSDSDPGYISGRECAPRINLSCPVQYDFYCATMYDETIITGSSISINSKMFKNKQTLLEYLEYYFDDRESNTEITKLSDPDSILKFVEKFHSNILCALRAYRTIFLCNEANELLLIVNKGQKEAIKYNAHVNFIGSTYRPTSFIVGPNAIFEYDLQYEKRINYSANIKGAHKLCT